MNNFNFFNNTQNDKLYIILSGLSGGKNEQLTKDLSSSLIKSGSILNVQFCNDPFYKNKNLEELSDLTFEKIFSVLDTDLIYAAENHGKEFSEIVFVGHSFSALILIYYLNILSKENITFKLVLLDKSNSKEIVEYMKTDQKDIILNEGLIKFLEENDEITILNNFKSSGIKIENIESDTLNTNHEFEGEEVIKTLSEKIRNI